MHPIPSRDASTTWQTQIVSKIMAIDSRQVQERWGWEGKAAADASAAAVDDDDHDDDGDWIEFEFGGVGRELQYNFIVLRHHQHQLRHRRLV